MKYYFGVGILLWMLLLGRQSSSKDLPKDFFEVQNRPKTDTTFVDCPQTSYNFPNNEQTTDYIRVTKPIPDLEEFTMCGWFTRYTNGDDYWISYASSPGGTNNFYFQIADSTTTRIAHNGHVIGQHLSFKANVEYHICIAGYPSSTGNFYIFVNGEMEAFYNFDAGRIRGEGVFIIGQEQDLFGGGFQSTQSCQGKLSNFMLWNRVFREADYKKMYQDRCRCPPNHTFTLENRNIEIFGGAVEVFPHQC